MDLKSTAKSKRSHTQHGRRAHLPPAALAHKKKAAGGDKTTSTHRGLPSNWDRYDEEISEGIDSNLANKEVADGGEVAPKSKGADFGYLIEQARSQPKDIGSVGSQGSSAVEEFSFDFMQGVSSMLSARGKNLLSRCGDDNFIVDDDSTSSYEVPFLTMDLNALSAQLSRLKLSQRLFIEADLLPEELNLEESEDSKTTSAATTLEISEPAEFDHIFDSGSFVSLPVLVNSANTQTRHRLNDGEMIRGAGAEKDKPRVPPLQSAELEAKSSIQPEQTTRFEATAVEAELDMLLDSFSETGVSAPKSPRDKPVTCIDDSIDDLLTETSTCLDDQKPSAPQQKAMSDSIDDSIDDLLAVTSVSLEGQQQTTNQQKKRTVASSEAMEDFDSWLDTL